MTTVKETNEEFFRRVVDAFNERDEEAFAETHTEDVVLHDQDEILHGVDAAVEHEWTLYDAFPDMEYRIEDVLAEGDRVAAWWRVVGTHEGEFAGIAPTGEGVDIPASDVFGVEDGRIAEV